jgi:hypothetical protein
VWSAFAVVVASAEDVGAYARRGRDARDARRRREAAYRDARTREQVHERVIMSTRQALAKTIAAAAGGHYELDARLAEELDETR